MPRWIILIALTLIVFGRSITFDFVGVDDSLHLANNPRLHPISARHIRQIWTSPYRGEFVPMTYMAWLPLVHFGRLATPDAQGNDLNPYLFHLLNVTLHVLAVLLAWRVLLRVIPVPWAAFAGAAVFAVHPLHVEAVAWISSCKDVLSGMFALAAMLFYLRFAQERSRAAYALGLLCFVMGLLSKAIVCMTPVILLVLLMIAPRVNRRRAIVWLWPWFLIVLPLVIWTRGAQTDAVLLTWSPLWARPLEALDAIAFYLGKVIWPIHLAVDYGRTPFWVIHHPRAWLLWPLPVAVAVLAIVQWRRWPWFWAGLVIFGVALLPVLGFVVFEFQGYSTVADRYTYLPLFGIALIAAGIASRARFNRGAVLIGVWIAALAVLAFVQTEVWTNSKTLFEHAVAVQPRSGFGWQGMGIVRGQGGDWAGAAAAYHHALSIRPDDLQAMASLMNAYRHLGDAANFHRAYAAMTYEAARRVLLKYPHNALALQRMAQAKATLATTRP